MKRINILLLAAVALMVAAASCKRDAKTEPAAPLMSADSTEAQPSAPDSTIYGIAIEGGMSTLNLITRPNGDTLLLDRDDERGYGEIVGYVEEGDSFAVTKRKGTDGDVVVRAYNLTLLKRFSGDFAVRNGLLVKGGDTVTVVTVDDDQLVVRSARTGHTETLKPAKR